MRLRGTGGVEFFTDTEDMPGMGEGEGESKSTR